MRKANLSSPRFIFERLEDRTVLNGTVIGANAAGALTLTGDAANNAIVVHQIGTNSNGGAIIQVLGAGTKINNSDTGTTSNSATFGGNGTTGITSIDIKLAGGSDVLTFYNTTVSGSIIVNMDDPSSGGVGDGNDVLTMINLHSTADTMTVGLGGGTNVATLFRVSSGSDFTLTGGDGHNVISLNSVSSNTSPSSANDTFKVTLGTGRFNTVVMVNCTDGPDGALKINNGGEDGVLVGALNSFGSQSDVTTFRFRAGDLRNNIV
jgi:hypothetical protein